MLITEPDWGGGGAFWRMVEAAWNACLVRDEDAEPVELTQSEVARAAGCAESLFRRYFRSRSDLFAEVAAVGFSLLAQSLRNMKGIEDLVAHWYGFQAALPRQYQVMFDREHQLHDKVYNQRRWIRTAIDDALNAELGRSARFGISAAVVEAILHGAVSASRHDKVPQMSAVAVIRGYVRRRGVSAPPPSPTPF